MTIKSERTYSFSHFCLEVAKGNIPGHEAGHWFSHNEATGTTLLTVWQLATQYVYPSSASVMKVSSSDANDTSAGTGARTVTIYGLDSDYVEASETVSLSGQTAVNTVNTYIRINSVVVNTAGSGGVNAGAIYVGTGTVTAGVPANKYGYIDPGYNHSLHGHFTVPANKKMFLHRFRISSGTQKATEVHMIQRPYGEVFQTIIDEHFFQDGMESNFDVPLVFTEKTDIEVQAKTSATTTELSVSGEGILVDYL